MFVGTHAPNRSQLFARDSGELLWSLDSDWAPLVPRIATDGRIALELSPGENVESSYWASLQDGAQIGELRINQPTRAPREDDWVLVRSGDGVPSWTHFVDGSKHFPTYNDWYFEDFNMRPRGSGELWYISSVDNVFSFVRESPQEALVQPLPEAQALVDDNWFVVHNDMSGAWSMVSLVDGDDTSQLTYLLLSPDNVVSDISLAPSPPGWEDFGFDANGMVLDSSGRIYELFRDADQAQMWTRQGDDPDDPWQSYGLPVADADSGRLLLHGASLSIWVQGAGGEWADPSAQALLANSLQIILPEADVVFLPYAGEQNPHGYALFPMSFGNGGRCLAYPPYEDADGVWTIQDLANNEAFTLPRAGQVIWLPG